MLQQNNYKLLEHFVNKNLKYFKLDVAENVQEGKHEGIPSGQQEYFYSLEQVLQHGSASTFWDSNKYYKGENMESQYIKEIVESIKDFKPTFLIIKQHSLTKLLYLHKTIQTNNPEKYLGSGSYWKKHINKHGRGHVETLWYCLYTNPADLVEAAINMSILYDIVNSGLWANQMIEHGLGGATKGIKRPQYWRDNISKTLTGRKQGPNSLEHNKKISESNKGKKASDDTRAKIKAKRASQIMKPKTDEQKKFMSKKTSNIWEVTFIDSNERIYIHNMCEWTIKNFGKRLGNGIFPKFNIKLRKLNKLISILST